MTLPLTKAEAISAGVRRYFPASPCQNGHISEFFVDLRGMGYCCECRRLSAKEAMRRFRERNPEKHLAASREYQRKARAKGSDWKSKNPEEFKKLKKEWNDNNRPKLNEAAMRRKASKILATPRWLTSEQNLEIVSLYTEAHNRSNREGIRYEVDHIVPLQGKVVCGLHVPWNLRVITAEENNRRPRVWDPNSEQVPW